MKYAPKKVFVLDGNTYLELTSEQFCQQKEQYTGRRFLPLHGMLMEVSEADYKEFYREQRRQKYLDERSASNGDFSYDMLTTDEFNGEDILVDVLSATADQAEKKIYLDKLRKTLTQLSNNERQLIQALYFDQLSEREYAAQIGVYHNAVHYRKGQILAKLKKAMYNK